MSASCCGAQCAQTKPPPPGYRRVLWVALVVNALMFGVELMSGWTAGSVALQADAVDFLGDATNYAISLFALTLGFAWRARTALLKGLTMGGYGLFIVGHSVWNVLYGSVPSASTMGVIGLVALIANVSVAALLFAYREGDANMRSVWLCSRNDAIGNVAVMLAALGVSMTRSAWPDLAVAAGMATLGLLAARSVTSQALSELRSAATPRAARVA